ncbi:MAG: hypothetical protein ACOC16_04040 [Nanoarchaeota archaeon]
MVNRTFIARFNFITNILLLMILVFGGFIWADTNGVWSLAEDIRAGTFGDDEGGGNYTFPENLHVNGELCLDGECYDDWKSVCQSWIESN